MNDFEFRVWWTYQLAADDYGVMRAEADVLQSANRALARRPKATVMRALDQLINVGLIDRFEHQGIRFVCQLTWQDFQKVRYPRETHQPLPPAAILARCSEATHALFSQRFTRTSAGLSAADDVGLSAASGPGSEPLPFRKDSGNVPEILPSLPRAGTRETATASGIRQAANGKRLTAAELDEQFGRFWSSYPRKVGRDAALSEFRKLAPDVELVDRMLAAIGQQRTSAQWLKDGGEFIPHPRTWLHQGRWKDEPLQQPRLSKRTIAAAQATHEFLKS